MGETSCDWRGRYLGVDNHGGKEPRGDPGRRLGGICPDGRWPRSVPDGFIWENWFYKTRNCADLTEGALWRSRGASLWVRTEPGQQHQPASLVQLQVSNARSLLVMLKQRKWRLICFSQLVHSTVNGVYFCQYSVLSMLCKWLSVTMDIYVLLSVLSTAVS